MTDPAAETITVVAELRELMTEMQRAVPLYPSTGLRHAAAQIRLVASWIEEGLAGYDVEDGRAWLAAGRHYFEDITQPKGNR